MEKILPVEEMLAYEEFTDRVEILRELDNWVKRIQIMGSPSTAIISPRRMGKTVLLDRLVNTVFFKPEYKVAPFYFRMKREDLTLRYFLLEYATTFFRQFIGYCHQDPELYRDRGITMENLLDFQSDKKEVAIAKTFMERFFNNYTRNLFNDSRNPWDAFICVPELLASRSGTRVAVIIDEFQDMQFYVHDVGEDSIKAIKNERIKNPGLVGINLPNTYDRQAQSRKAPMLVSGSAVTLVFRTVMGGPLGGRFFFKYLKPMLITEGAKLLYRLLDIYNKNKKISSEDALYASTKLNGHPYYIYCLAMSPFEENIKTLNRENIDNIIRYEIERGNIFGFWQTHFDMNRKYINADTDEETGKKIIYYFTKYNNRPVEIKEIAETLGIPKKTVEEKIEKLYLADLVYKSAAKFYTFNDICLMRFIKFVYEKDLEGVDEIDLSQQNLFNNLKGHFLEMVVQVTMMKFNKETLDGKYFGKSQEITLPKFDFVDTKYVKGSRTPQYQIDLYARYNENQMWICECKYTKTKMGIRQVKKLERAGKALIQEAVESKYSVPEIQMWLVSTGGFTKEALKYAKNREDIYLSDHEEINSIFRFYGGNYKIPLFSSK